MMFKSKPPISTAVCYLILVLSITGCATFPKSPREDQWSYFEEWDSNRNVSIDSTEFFRGYIEQDFFTTWAGKKKEIDSEVLAAKLDNADNRLKKALAYSNHDSVASARRQSGISSDNQTHSTLEFVNKADRNTNRRITEEEWASAMFKVADENSDGVLTPIEFYLWQLLRA